MLKEGTVIQKVSKAVAEAGTHPEDAIERLSYALSAVNTSREAPPTEGEHNAEVTIVAAANKLGDDLFNELGLPERGGWYGRFMQRKP